MACAVQVHTRKLKLDPDVTDDVLQQVARDLPGLSGQAMASHARFLCQAFTSVGIAVLSLKDCSEDT